MKSMTGYGRGVCNADGIEMTVEVKSVNNRFLDLSVKCPRIFLAQEEHIRTVVRSRLPTSCIPSATEICSRYMRSRASAPQTGASRPAITARVASMIGFFFMTVVKLMKFFLRKRRRKPGFRERYRRFIGCRTSGTPVILLNFE